MRMRQLLPVENAAGSTIGRRRRLLVGNLRLGTSASPPLPSPIFAPDLGGITLHPAATTRGIYVDVVDGSDSYDGLWPSFQGGTKGPKKTAAAGMSVVGNGSSDWLLFRRGQTWQGADLYDGVTTDWTGITGASVAAPIVVASYGEASLPNPIFIGDDSTVPAPTNVDDFSSKKNHSTGITTIAKAAALYTPPTADALGWTQFAPSTDSLIVYVDYTNGNDSANGLTPTTPKKTISAAKAMLRPGFPDWMVLARGITWPDGLGQWSRNGVPMSGRSAAEPMVVTWYGNAGARPNIQGNFFAVNGLANVAFLNLEVGGPTDNNAFQVVAGTNVPGSIQNVTIEGCKIHNVFNGVYADGVAGLIVRRNIIYLTGENGLLVGHTANVLIEGNLIDSPGQHGNDFPGHCIYLNGDNSYPPLAINYIVRGNVVTRAAAKGITGRVGQNYYNNFFGACPYPIGFGGQGNNDDEPGGVTGTIRGNVSEESGDIPVNAPDGNPYLYHNPAGTGIIFANTLSCVATYNLFKNNTQSTGPQIAWIRGTGEGNPPKAFDVTLQHNIWYKWGGDLRIDGDITQVQRLDFEHNDVQNLTGTPLASGPLSQNLSQTVDVVGNITFSNNRWQSTAAADHKFADWHGNRTLAQWNADVFDASSTMETVSYTDATVSIGKFYDAYISGSGSTLDTYVEGLKACDLTQWNLLLWPEIALDSADPGTAWNAYPVGAVASATDKGPIRYLRGGFNQTLLGMGMSITGPSTSPATGAAAGGTSVTITGSGFLSGPRATPVVQFGAGNLADSVTSVTDTQIVAVTAAGSAGAVDVIVDNGDGIYTLANGFTYT